MSALPKKVVLLDRRGYDEISDRARRGSTSEKHVSKIKLLSFSISSFILLFPYAPDVPPVSLVLLDITVSSKEAFYSWLIKVASFETIL